MPSTYSDQFFVIDPGSAPAVGTSLNFIRSDFTDQDDDGNIASNSGDTWNGNEISSVWENDTVTVNVPGVGDITYTGVTFYFVNGDPAVFTPTDGQILQNGTFVSSTWVTTATQTPVTSTGPTCFTPGTMIDTPGGAQMIETLSEGDLVNTLDDGPQPIRLILDAEFPARGDFAPIQFDAGAIGNDEPLVVSPQHRVLIKGWQAQLFYGQEEVLVAAKHLVNGTTVRRISGGNVRYLHLLFDKHQIIWGQGVPSESYYPGHAMEAGDKDQQAELIRLFPQLACHAKPTASVRPVLKRREARLLAA